MTSTEVETVAQQPIVEKPLNATQAKNLKQIIDSDFKELQYRLEKQIEDRKQARLKEIAAQYGDDEVLQAVRAEGQELIDRLRVEANEWADAAKARGITAQGGVSKLMQIGWTPYNLKYEGNEIEVQKVTQATNRLRELVRHYVAQLQRTAERKVLLATVTGGIASQLLGEIPGIDDAMNHILGLVSDDASDEIRTLMADAGVSESPSLTA